MIWDFLYSAFTFDTGILKKNFRLEFLENGELSLSSTFESVPLEKTFDSLKDAVVKFGIRELLFTYGEEAHYKEVPVTYVYCIAWMKRIAFEKRTLTRYIAPVTRPKNRRYS